MEKLHKEKVEMFCPNCGYKLSDDASFCTNCGTNIKTTSQAQSSNHAAPARTGGNVTNTIAIVGFILSFFIVIAGLICSIIGYNNAKRGAPYKGLAIAGIVISAVWLGIVFISLFAAL